MYFVPILSGASSSAPPLQRQFAQCRGDTEIRQWAGGWGFQHEGLRVGIPPVWKDQGERSWQKPAAPVQAGGGLPGEHVCLSKI